MSTKLEALTGFARRLRAARELRVLSQEDLARKSGLQSTAISHFETGRRRPSHANLLRLADALDVSTDYLTGRVDTTIERDALRAECERLRRESVPMCVPTAEGFRRVGGRRLLAAAQSLHRAWRREREERLRACAAWQGVSFDDQCDACGAPAGVPCDCALKDSESDMSRLSAFVGALRDDGLDIDDPDTAPTWTGKIHAPDGRLLFDLATARACDHITAEMHAATGIPRSALCHHQDRTHCAGCPDDATCEASGREPRKP